MKLGCLSVGSRPGEHALEGAPRSRPLPAARKRMLSGRAPYWRHALRIQALRVAPRTLQHQETKGGRRQKLDAHRYDSGSCCGRYSFRHCLLGRAAVILQESLAGTRQNLLPLYRKVRRHKKARVDPRFCHKAQHEQTRMTVVPKKCRLGIYRHIHKCCPGAPIGSAGAQRRLAFAHWPLPHGSRRPGPRIWDRARSRFATAPRQQANVRSLFVRQTRKNDNGSTAPYVFLGPLKYVSHEGEQLMSILWRVRTPIPADFQRQTHVAAWAGIAGGHCTGRAAERLCRKAARALCRAAWSTPAAARLHVQFLLRQTGFTDHAPRNLLHAFVVPEEE